MLMQRLLIQLKISTCITYGARSNRFRQLLAIWLVEQFSANNT
jgi:hypothetical protein